jgi:hypothetical protein
MLLQIQCGKGETRVAQPLQSPINQGHARIELLLNLENHAGHVFRRFKGIEDRLDSKPQLQGGSPQRGRSARLREVGLVAPSRLVVEKGDRGCLLLRAESSARR